MAQLLDIAGLRERTTNDFRSALIELSNAHGLNPSFIAAVMSYESGFDPNIPNGRGAPALGLIQFWKSYFPGVAKLAESLFPSYTVPGRTWDDLWRMTAVEELPYVIAFYVQKSSLNLASSPTDYYMSTFLPAFVGYPPDKVLGVKGSKDPLLLKSGKSVNLSLGEVYDDNPGFDSTKKGFFTVADVGKKIETIVAAAKKRPPLEVELVPLAVSFAALGKPAPKAASAGSSPLPPVPSSSSSSKTVAAAKADTTVPIPPATIEPLGPQRSGELELPIITVGMKGPAVLLWQTLLNVQLRRRNATRIDVDGWYGEQTAGATMLVFNTRTVDRYTWNHARAAL